MDWTTLYPAFTAPQSEDTDAVVTSNFGEALPRPLVKDVTIADIGCGFGGLLFALGPKLPDELIIGR